MRTELAIAAGLILAAPAWAEEEPDGSDASDASDAPPDAPPEDPPPDDGWLEVGVDVDFGSAVETGLEDEAAQQTLPPELAGMVAAAVSEARSPQAAWSRRWGVRPWVGWAGLSSSALDSGATLGGLLTHQWWSLRERAVRPAGETRLHAVGAVGGLGGWSARLDATAGAWLGPIGLLGGGQVQADRLTGAAATLETGMAVGPTLRLAARLGPVTPWAGFSPGWLVAGPRAGRADLPWDEQAVQAGVVWDRRPIGLRLTGEWRRVAPGDLYGATLGLHLRPF